MAEQHDGMENNILNPEDNTGVPSANEDDTNPANIDDLPVSPLAQDAKGPKDATHAKDAPGNKPPPPPKKKKRAPVPKAKRRARSPLPSETDDDDTQVKRKGKKKNPTIQAQLTSILEKIEHQAVRTDELYTMVRSPPPC